MLTRPQILQHVQELLGAAAGIENLAQITPDTRIYHDLATDGLSLITIVAAIEDRFGFVHSVERWARLVGRDNLAVGDLIDHIAEHFALQQLQAEQVPA